jgi:hypothetical protein
MYKRCCIDRQFKESRFNVLPCYLSVTMLMNPSNRCLSAWPKKLTLQPYRADPRDIIKQAQTLKCPTVLIKADTSASKSLENFEGVYQLLCRSGVCASCRFDDKSGIILFPARENCFIGVVFVQMPAFY